MRQKRVRCECGMMVVPWQQKFHEKSVWHRRRELIRRSIDAGLTNSEIARLVGVTAAYVGQRLRAERVEAA
jgi:hypothetical protein